MGKTKDAAADTAQGAADKAYDVEEGARGAVGEAVGKVKDTVSDTAKKAYDKAGETKESVKDAATGTAKKAYDKAGETKENVKDAASGAAETAKKAYGKAGETKENVKDAASGAQRKAAETAKKAYDKAGETKENVKDVASNVHSKAKDTVSNKASEMKESAAEKAERAKREAQEMAKGSANKAKKWWNPLRNKVMPGWMATVTGVMHLLGFAVAYGMSSWVTFGSSYVLSKVLPKQQFAMVQSKMYPVYFRAMAYSVGTALLGYLMSGKRMVSSISLAAPLAMILGNMLYLEPRATKVMFERMRKEKEEGGVKEGQGNEAIGKVVESRTETTSGATTTTVAATTTPGATTREKVEGGGAKSRIMGKPSEILRRLNSYSSILNVLTLMSLTWHLVHLGHHLHAVC